MCRFSLWLTRTHVNGERAGDGRTARRSPEGRALAKEPRCAGYFRVTDGSEVVAAVRGLSGWRIRVPREAAKKALQGGKNSLARASIRLVTARSKKRR